MNDQRRKAISELVSELEALKEKAESLRDEEQEYFDAMHDNLKGGDKGSAAEEAISNLEEAVSGIETAIDALNNASGG